MSYQRERQAKLNFIEEAVIANGYDSEEFLQLLVKEKRKRPLVSSSPADATSVDSFSLEEIKAVVQKEAASHSEFGGRPEELKVREALLRSKQGSEGNSLFNTNINRDESLSVSQNQVLVSAASGAASGKKATLQVHGTILNQNKSVVCHVHR